MWFVCARCVKTTIFSDEKWDFHKSKVEGNTGFYFVRSNNNTVQLWANAYAAAPK